ncbi:MAG: hypothetical protein U9Q76_02415 [candidate division WOR-3 bacterium]|nr:hypothetical protein [candidate division WOR-3 bacterium]
MPNETKLSFLEKLRERYGALRKLEKSQSLYEIGEGAARIYIRYSKIHGKGVTFYGLREEDLQRLEGYSSIICFLWNNQDEPLFLPFEEFEEVFQTSTPASDGQYKVQIYLQADGTDLYVTKAGRFNVESYFGWEQLEAFIDSSKMIKIPELSHPQVQTLLGSIGARKGFDIWIPPIDRTKLDWSLTGSFKCRDTVPYGFESVKDIIEEIDVIWIHRGSGGLRALFEVEHTTSIYSGLLRFNDIHLATPSLKARFSIAAKDARRSLFVRQLNRPTFVTSGLNEICTFLKYANVFNWHNRVKAQ